MKKILSLILVLASLISLYACNDNKKYEPVESTAKEATPVMIFEADGDKYEVRYELYRALFLTYAPNYDNGDKNFWKTEASAEAKADINNKIKVFASEIYATLHHAKKIGLDPFSKETDEKIYEYIKSSVEGDKENEIEGFKGDYNAYLSSLRQMNLNYSVQVLLLRYTIAHNNIITYYAGSIDLNSPTSNMQEGTLKYTRDDVYSFYIGDSCARVSSIEINNSYMSEKRIQEIRDQIASYSDAESALNYAIGCTTVNPDYVKNGQVIGTLSMDKAYYSEVINVAFALKINETSQPIKVSLNNSSESWILYKLEKNDIHFNNCYDEIEETYVNQQIGLILYTIESSLLASVQTTTFFDSMDYSSISMDET